MYHLVYTSNANLGLTETELQGQLAHWRSTNARLNITGLLLFSTGGNIMQVLEGEALEVQRLYAVIAADVRHRNVVKLADGPVPDRAFADCRCSSAAWSPPISRASCRTPAPRPSTCATSCRCLKPSWPRSP